jgi:hypothetical protein
VWCTQIIKCEQYCYLFVVPSLLESQCHATSLPLRTQFHFPHASQSVGTGLEQKWELLTNTFCTWDLHLQKWEQTAQDAESVTVPNRWFCLAHTLIHAQNREPSAQGYNWATLFLGGYKDGDLALQVGGSHLAVSSTGLWPKTDCLARPRSNCTVNYRSVLLSERVLQNNKPATVLKNKEKEISVTSPRWAPDTKTDWPTDCRS